MILKKSKPRIEQLDQYLADRDYTLALEAIAEEIKSKPENFNWLLRQAEILGLAGDRARAIDVYRKLAKHYAEQGFYARAIAVTKKVLSLDPKRQEVNQELADLIAAQREAEDEVRSRFKLKSAPGAKPAKMQEPPPPPPPKPEPTLPLQPPQPPPRRLEPAPPPPPSLPPSPPELEMMPPPPLPLEPVPMPFEEPPAPPPPRSRPAVAQPRRAPAARHAEPGRAADEAITPVQAAKEREASRFFSDFPRAALEELLSTTSIRSFGPQQVIVREGEPGTSLFLIEEGIVVVFTSGPDQLPLRLAEMGPGEFFGEVAVLTGRPRTATIIAQTPVTALEISSEDLHRLAIRHPEVHQILRRFYERRAQATVEAVLARIRGQRE